jgi:hypothetical protein
MISYFKYTGGESFTLNNSDYFGYFNVVDDIVYAGRIKTNDSEILTPKLLFLSDFYTNQLEYDSTYMYSNNISYYYTNTFDLLNKQGFDDLVNTINLNNLKCYGNLLLQRPTIFDMQKSNVKYYGLSSLFDRDIVRIPSNNYFGSVIPFSRTNTLGFLDNIKASTFIVNSDNEFKYYCADNNGLYLFTGDFDGLGELEYVDSFPNEDSKNIIESLYNDDVSKTMIIVGSLYILTYDTSNYELCNKPVLINRISSVGLGNPKFIKFGNNFRTSLKDGILSLYNKYAVEKIFDIDLSIYNISNVIDLDIRNVDDAIIILHKIGNDLYTTFFDPIDIKNTITTTILYKSDELSDIKFTSYDSNLFSTKGVKSYQHRFITHPQYPCSEIDTYSLYYNKFKWNDDYIRYDNIPIMWDASEFNVYTNLTVNTYINDDKMYMIIHNKGRIYTLFQKMEKRFLNLVPLVLEKYFNLTNCTESSLGLHMNVIFTNIIKDVLILYNNASSTANFKLDQFVLKQLEKFDLSPKNLSINGNETVNTLVLQRLTSLITDIQTNLLPTST